MDAAELTNDGRWLGCLTGTLVAKASVLAETCGAVALASGIATGMGGQRCSAAAAPAGLSA